MNTKRCCDTERSNLPTDLDEDTICYWRNSGGVWFMHLPGVGLGNLSRHQVVEHEDGTITVSPSILVTTQTQRRHGFLRRGIWEPCGDDNSAVVSKV